MKKSLKIISIASIILFGILWVLSKFVDSTEFNTMDIRNILVLIYLVTSLKYYQMEVKDKNSIIEELQTKLVEK
ncbi:hypothetical protein [Daejeonella oryzae]|uniref:hypothetical protein n=1 Tax=Daejeonella oryzae TaxID=1122943 RepID=UPI00041234E7|nr:hypothetical protein [Daejeonella oryzae]